MSRLLALAAISALFVLYLSGITSFGLVGPDEPRYASIGREMARSGDLVTPRLWGEPWFEKPPLLYWMSAAGFRAGLDSEAAPRLPVAIASILFLLFYFFWVRREFNPFVGGIAACLLGSSAIWLGYSHAAVTDIPLAATFAATLLLLLPVVEGRPARVTAAAALLGLSVLAKGLVPLVLIIPLLWFARRHWRIWLRPLPVITFMAVTLPWYIACTIRNGPKFLEVFFLQQQLGRFTSDSLQHVQPFWFYVPVLLGALFPMTLLGGYAGVRVIYHDRRRQCLLAVFLFGFLFFSASRNKLPGYLLPLLPALFILIASGVDAARYLYKQSLGVVTALSTLLLPLFVVAASLLPKTLAGGVHDLLPIDLGTAGRVAATIPLVIVLNIGLVFVTRERALAIWLATVFAGWLFVEYAGLPWVDGAASARTLWREASAHASNVCAGAVTRSWQYGLNYYAGVVLPDCRKRPELVQIVPGPTPGSRPRFETADHSRRMPQADALN